MEKNQFGKVSEIRLEAALKDGKTILKDVFFTAPFKVMHPFYEKKDLMTVMLLIASAGIMEGDRQLIDIRADEGARMEFVSQSYEKLHRMPEGYAERSVHIHVDKNAYLAYTPLPVIPFRDSDFRSNAVIELEDDTSQFVMTEVLTCGRVAHGEEFQFRKFKNKISILKNGKLIYRDNTLYEPENMDMNGFGMYEGFTHLGNMVICNMPKDQNWIAEVRKFLDDQADIEGGATLTASKDVVVRMLGKSGDALTNIQRKIMEKLQKSLAEDQEDRQQL